MNPPRLSELEEITQTFELMFAKIIKNFEGSHTEFSSAEEAVNSIF